MTNWIRESVFIMATGQKLQVYLHSVRHSSCATYTVSELSYLSEHNHSFPSLLIFLSTLCLFSECHQATCTNTDLQSCASYGTLHIRVLFVETCGDVPFVN